MVSSALKMDLGRLLAALERIRTTCRDDPEYRRLRAAFPKSWPM